MTSSAAKKITDKQQTSRGLGKGLAALIGDYYVKDEDQGTVQVLSTHNLKPGHFQPRNSDEFTDEKLASLRQSIREHGVLQPILVRPHREGEHIYEIIAGERRWRAAQKENLNAIPVIIKHFSDEEALEVALVENLQRQDLIPMDESDSYQRLMDEFSYTQEKLAQAVSKSRSHIANMLRLQALPHEVKAFLNSGQLTIGHARALLTAKDPVALAKLIIQKQLNVRETERLVQRELKAKTVKISEKDEDLSKIEQDISSLIHLPVEIKVSKSNSGRFIVKFDNLKELDDLLTQLSHTALIHQKD